MSWSEEAACPAFCDLPKTKLFCQNLFLCFLRLRGHTERLNRHLPHVFQRRFFYRIRCVGDGGAAFMSYLGQGTAIMMINMPWCKLLQVRSRCRRSCVEASASFAAGQCWWAMLGLCLTEQATTSESVPSSFSSRILRGWRATG